MISSLNGSCEIIFNDGKNEEKFTLNSKTEGVLIDGFIWREMKNFSKDCFLVCLTDKLYKDTEYIRDFELFKMMVDNQCDIK